MKRLLVAAVLVCATTGLAHAETRDVTAFTQVKAEDQIRVEIATGDRYEVSVVGRDANRIRTRVDRGELRIWDHRRPMFGRMPRLDASIRVTAPRLDAVSAARGAEVRATIAGACHDFSASAAMGGEMSVTGLTCDSVDAAASMGGVLRLAGECRTMSASASMGGDIRANELRCRTVDGAASMGGAMHVFASESYEGSASMGGSIDVAGGARRGDVTAAMGGSVSHN